jgi:DNA-binding transcriptional LysR family regulator
MSAMQTNASDRSLPDATRLGLFVDVARHGSIAKAARVNGVTASAVSQQISALERECGVTLLERLPRGVALTAAGEVLVERGRTIVRLLEKARADLDTFDDRLAGRVRIGTIASAAASIALLGIRLLADLHPDVVATVRVDDPRATLSGLQEGRIDLALIDVYDHAPMPIPARLTAETVLSEPLVVISDAPFASRPALAELADDGWVMPPPDTACGRRVVRPVRHACRQAGFEPQVRWQTDDLHLLSAAVAAGQGISLLPRLATDREHPGLHSVTPRGTDLRRDVRAVVRTTEANRAVLLAVKTALRTAVEAEGIS